MVVSNKNHNENDEMNDDGRFGVVVGILAYYARGRGFDSSTVQIIVCMNMYICTGSGCFYVIGMH
jgi:hypothetical protein